MADRIVSLVPSLTEAIAATLPGRIVAATDYCTHPGDLDVARIRGTKNPDVDQIISLAPDLVVANAEENRAADLDRLRDAGLAVHVMYPTTVPDALDALSVMLHACGTHEDPEWLSMARAAWSAPEPAPIATAVIPIWRRPWMVLGRDTFAGDVLARCGVMNAFAGIEGIEDHYPKVSVEQILATEPDLLVLPDEPYAFSDDDGPEAFDGIPHACVSGRDLTWYGPSLVGARKRLTTAIETALSRG
jgi:ABC-type Fe3+-hydroxamate transport system substrate-binding protein